MVVGEWAKSKKFLLLPPPTESGRLTAIPENFCYYPPPLNLPGLRRSRKISAATPPTESGRPPEITENWPPPKKILATPLHPLITRPTRITSHSKTLIDNIFTSDLSSEIYSGLIINDVSDHLPIYQITEYAHCTNMKIVYNKRRVVNEKNLAVLINDLKETNWNTVIHSENVNFMYDTFSEKLANSYNKNCPIINEKIKKNRTDKPWMTKSLINACKKKNLLYREFLKKRTDECESKYKRYKNKLTSILRYCEKQYYTEILDLNKGNVKGSFHVKSSDFWPFFHGPPPILLKFGTLVEIV